MTKEEAVKGLTSLVKVRRKYVGMQTMKDEIECLDMAIKALEQEPCEDMSYELWKESYEVLKERMDRLTLCGDAISRKALLDDLYGRDYTKFTHRDFVALVQYQDTVQPKQIATNGDMSANNTKEMIQIRQRTGHWIYHHRTDLGVKLNDMCECSECGKWFSLDEMLYRSYCPNCGAKME